VLVAPKYVALARKETARNLEQSQLQGTARYGPHASEVAQRQALSPEKGDRPRQTMGFYMSAIAGRQAPREKLRLASVRAFSRQPLAGSESTALAHFNFAP
jgi:hypothetical protein